MIYVIYFATLFLTFGLTFVISKKLIPILKSHKMGQKILEIGPRWHLGKEGTPTMGGIAFIIASTLVALCGMFALYPEKKFSGLLPFLFTFVYALLNGAIGIIDDLAKLRHKANEGLTALQKYLLQLLAAVLYLVAMVVWCDVSTVIPIPFTSYQIDLSWGFYPAALLLLTGVVNSVNLNDGIDGLCSSLTLLVGVFFSLTGLVLTRTDSSLVLLGGLMTGAGAGFLMYNFYPARVFMGDTGSLFFGGLVVGGAFMLHTPLLVLIYGLVYVLETLSVMLQVGYFKLTHGKRLFKMSPIHHHFEKCGWSEIKIVLVFSAVTALMCILAFIANL